MVDLEPITCLLYHITIEIAIIISDDCLGNPKSTNDVVLDAIIDNLLSDAFMRCGLSPFGVVNCNKDKPVSV